MRILITGAGSGIGEGLALGLAGDDREIWVTDVDLDAAHRVSEAIRIRGHQAQGIALDVTDSEQINALGERVAQDSIEVLINNAGIQQVARLEDLSTDAWQRLIAVLLDGTAMMCRALLPAMRALGHGRIINIGSVHSLVASPYKSAYVAAKHGVLGLSKVLALETADTDITVNTICPGYVDTPLVRRQIADQAKEHGMSEEEVVQKVMLDVMPKGEFIKMPELVAAAEFLMADTARNITGQTLTIDGGWTAR